MAMPHMASIAPILTAAMPLLLPATVLIATKCTAVWRALIHFLPVGRQLMRCLLRDLMLIVLRVPTLRRIIFVFPATVKRWDRWFAIRIIAPPSVVGLLVPDHSQS